MARRARIDRLTGYGAVYRWLWRHRRVLTDAFARTGPVWSVVQPYLADEGVVNQLGAPPTRQALSETWARVRRNAAREAEIRAKLPATTSHRSRRGHWEPPEAAPSSVPCRRSAAPPAPSMSPGATGAKSIEQYSAEQQSRIRKQMESFQRQCKQADHPVKWQSRGDAK